MLKFLAEWLFIVIEFSFIYFNLIVCLVYAHKHGNDTYPIQ